MNLQPARVLLVEDDDGDALLVREMLADVASHLEILHGRSIAEAAVLLESEAVACVLLDLGLPDAHGLEAVERLRAWSVPIIVLTGLNDERRGIESLGAGAQEYLVKDQVNGPLLLRAMRYAVERSQAEAGARELLEAQMYARENMRLERGLLPTALIRDPAVRVTATYRPGRRRALLGGDFYDSVELADGSVCAIIGDVSGHGPDEAALGVCLRVAWRTLMLANSSIEDALEVLDQVLVQERPDPKIFATASAVRLLPDRSGAELYAAGHPGPVLLGNGAAPELITYAQINTPLGIANADPWMATSIALPAAASLLLYTDGLVEGHIGEGHERLGLDGLVGLLVAGDPQLGDSEADEAFLAQLVQQVEELNGGDMLDDLAMVLLSWS